MTNTEYATTEQLAQFMQVENKIPDPRVVGGTRALELLGTGDGTTVKFPVDNAYIIANTYTFYYGATEATALSQPLTETTHYTLDKDGGILTLTSAGATLVSTNKIYGAYSFSSYKITDSQMQDSLNRAACSVESKTGTVFATYSDTNPAYRKITGETFYANNPSSNQYATSGKVYDFFFTPIVKLSTTVATDYTLGETSLVLTDATGFPETGTIYIGSNKVAYTAKSTNTLTVPATTPSIDADAVVVGEVIEVSKEPEGSSPSWEVLDPETSYRIDYVHGRLQLLNSAYWGEMVSTGLLYPTNYLIRVSYMNAWHEEEQNPSIPDDIKLATLMLAANDMMHLVVRKRIVEGGGESEEGLVDIDKNEIAIILENYTVLGVGTSPYNRSKIS